MCCWFKIINFHAISWLQQKAMWQSAFFVSDIPLLISYFVVVYMYYLNWYTTHYPQTNHLSIYIYTPWMILFSVDTLKLMFWIEIMDINGGGSILYMLNSGKMPPNPTVWNFTYDLSSLAFQVNFLDVEIITDLLSMSQEGDYCSEIVISRTS